MADRPFSASVARTAACNGTDTDVITLATGARYVRIVGRDLTGQMSAAVTVDGAWPTLAATPTVGGDDTVWLGPRDVVVIETPPTGATVVRITSATAYPYYVTIA